jgi:hypothetical protein
MVGFFNICFTCTREYYICIPNLTPPLQNLQSWKLPSKMHLVYFFIHIQAILEKKIF